MISLSASPFTRNATLSFFIRSPYGLSQLVIAYSRGDLSPTLHPPTSWREEKRRQVAALRKASYVPRMMRLARLVEPHQQALRILIVQLLEHVFWQENSIDHPEPLPVVPSGGVKVLVVGFEEAVVHAIRLPVRRRVGAEHDSVLVLDEEPPRGVGLPAELGDARVDVDVHVRVRVEPVGDRREVLAVVGEVGADERGVRVPRDHANALGVQLGTRWEPVTIEEPVRVLI